MSLAFLPSTILCFIGSSDTATRTGVCRLFFWWIGARRRATPSIPLLCAIRQNACPVRSTYSSPSLEPLVSNGKVTSTTSGGSNLLAILESLDAVYSIKTCLIHKKITCFSLLQGIHQAGLWIRLQRKTCIPQSWQFDRNRLGSHPLHWIIVYLHHQMISDSFRSFWGELCENSRSHWRRFRTCSISSWMAYTSSMTVATATVMHREPWLHLSGFLREAQNTIEDLLFDESHLFNQKTDEPLHTLKDCRAILHSLGIYTPAPTRKFHHQSPPTGTGPPNSITRDSMNLCENARKPKDFSSLAPPCWFLHHKPNLSPNVFWMWTQELPVTESNTLWPPPLPLWIA